MRSDAVQEVLALLNDDPSQVYVLGYSSHNKSWGVIHLVQETNHPHKDKILYRQIRLSSTHSNIDAALHDALLLRPHSSRLEGMF